jgi:hypothetical protein
VLPLLLDSLAGQIVYQHSGFDQSAVSAACREHGLTGSNWEWRDSVIVAREAWPELKGSGGHGLASLKQYLDLQFNHHDAGEDARASAEVVLLAESLRGKHSQSRAPARQQAAVSSTPSFPEAIVVAKRENSRQRRKAGRPILANPVRDEIVARIGRHSDIQPHASEREAQGTKYISAYTIGGVVFAVDKMSTSKQPIWVLDRVDLRSHLDAENVEYEIYPPERGRNSNLHKLPNFKSGQLLRVFPETVEQGLSIIAKIGG